MKPSFPPISRRAFATSLAVAPALLAQQTPQPTYAPGAPGPFRRQIQDAEPFTELPAFSRRDATPKVRPFPMQQVRLLAGPFQRTSDANRSFMNRLPAERLLHNFRLTAGLPSAATPFGGWEKPDCELRGHFVGHYLSACGLLYASTGDSAAKAQAGEMVNELAKCQAKLDSQGYLSAYPTSLFDKLDRGQNVWAPFYTFHKILSGLIDAYVHCENKQALKVAAGMADWVDQWTAAKSEAHMQEILRVEFGGMSEALYDLAALTGDVRWAKAGDRFTKTSFVNPLALRRDELKGLHANTHIPQVIGAARRYELSSDPRFHDLAAFFWDTVASARTYAAGGTSNAEHWMAQPGHLAQELKSSTHHQECCCSYNMMKLTRHLYEWTADARYFDYYERNLYNHRLGAIHPETGNSVYFLSMAPAAWKGLCTDDRSFWCCTGTALEDGAKFNDSIYYHDAGGVYVNLYIASELKWTEKGIYLRQETRFPDEPRTVLTVTATPAAEWTLRVRIPAWTNAASVSINGRKLEAGASPGSYLNIARVWKTGDKVALELPMRLTAEPLPDDPKLQAFLYGPIVLAGELGTGGLTDALVRDQQGPEVHKAPLPVPGFAAPSRDLWDWIKPTGSMPLTFRTTGQSQDVTLSPLNRLWQRYAVYWNIT